jgi:P pilus assembly chaperone PapD
MLRFILFAFILSIVSASHAAITLGATRVVYQGDKKEASISLSNSDPTRPYLVQSWITTIEGKPNQSPFVITPPIFKLEANTENKIRIAYVKDILPQDRESLYTLNINAIPSVEKKDASRIIITTKNVLKLIYRPAALSTKDAAVAYKKLMMVKQKGNVLLLSNPTPFYINIGTFFADGEAIQRIGYIEPFGSKQVKGAPKSVLLTVINDYGGLTSERAFSF